MRIVRFGAAMVLAVAITTVPPAVGPGAGIPAAQASSVATASGGNCNNWYPFGESSTSWSGYSSGWASVSGDLKWGSTTMVSGSADGTGGSGYVAVNNPYPASAYGTGWWTEYGSHTGSMISGTIKTSKSIWCG